ncbi:hypothetical protein GJ633_04115 [Halorubrum sp. CBA1125]|nr:hypothetical protein [Halorubrum sp. CBA1125]
MPPDVSPPTEWYEPTECPREECEVTKFVPLAMDLHLVRDHDSADPQTVPEQVDGVSR